MFKLFLILFIFGLIFFLYKNKIKIKWKTFFKKGFKVDKGVFGIYCYVGTQGSGKTYSCAEYVLDNYSNILLFSNITLYNISYVHYDGFSELLQLKDCIDFANSRNNDFLIFKGQKIPYDRSKQIVFIYDEIFSALSKGDRLSKPVLNFITQMRKRKFILLTTAQIWSDIPITWRRTTRYQIDCKLIRLIFFNLLIKVFHDAENMKWSNDDQEFIAPIISTTISHTRKFIADSYDTFEVISEKQN